MLVEWTSKWFKIEDNKNNIVIDDFDYKNGILGPIITKHCIKCIASNQCWFLDEESKKPKEAKYGIEEMIKVSKNMFGLYHYNCHCKKIDIPKPMESEIKLIIPQGKIEWLKKDKIKWVTDALGWEIVDEFLEHFKKQVLKSYCAGKYYILGIDNHGVAISVKTEISGSGEKTGRTYIVRSGWMVFSNGKLKNNTIIAGWWGNEIV